MPEYMGLTDADNNLVTTISNNGVRALAVDIAGSTGSSVTFSIANVLKYSQISSEVSWTTVLNETVPADKVWYLKGLILSTEAFATVRIKIDDTIKMTLRCDADDVNEIDMKGFQVNSSSSVKVEMDAGGVGKELNANLIILEE